MLIDKHEDVFHMTRKENFLEVLKFAKTIKEDIPIDYLYQCYLDKNPNLNELQTIWEKSLETFPDYSVYGRDDYLNEVFVCWKTYSVDYLRRLRKYLQREDSKIDSTSIKRVLDLGCGLGFTTIGLKTLFPNAEIIGTNTKNTLQYRFNEKLMESIDGCRVVDDNLNLKDHVDIIFASEFFEHIESPIDLLGKLIEKYHPNYIIFANTFTQMAIGHFKEYNYSGFKISGKEMPRIFSKTLQSYNYWKVKDTHFYNNRPNIYELGDLDKE